MLQRNAIIAVGSVVLFALAMILLSCSSQSAQAQSITPYATCTGIGSVTVAGTNGSTFTFACSPAAPPICNLPTVTTNCACVPPDVSTDGVCTAPVVTPPAGGGSAPACSSSQQSDTAFPLARVCGGGVENPYLQTFSTADFDLFDAIWGPWPVNPAVSGSARVVTLQANQYIALAFVPSPGATIKINASSSYGGGTLSVSTKPGGFTKGDTAYGVVCSVANGGSTNITISSNGTQGPCQVSPGQTYYLNISSIKASGQRGCVAASCNAAFTVTQVN